MANSPGVRFEDPVMYATSFPQIIGLVISAFRAFSNRPLLSVVLTDYALFACALVSLRHLTLACVQGASFDMDLVAAMAE